MSERELRERAEQLLTALGYSTNDEHARAQSIGTVVTAFQVLLAQPSSAPAGAYQEEPGRDYRKERDLAYTERNRLVAALARLIVASGGKAWLAEHPEDPAWDPEWKTIVFVEGPTGQLSWHLHDTDVPLFAGLPRGPNSWDGHSTPEKYERVARLAAPSPEGAPEGSGDMRATEWEVEAVARHLERIVGCDGEEAGATAFELVKALGAPSGAGGDVRVLAEQQARAARLFAQGRDQERIAVVAGALAREASTWEVAATDTVWRHLALAALATDADYRASANAAEQEGDVRVLVEAIINSVNPEHEVWCHTRGHSVSKTCWVCDFCDAVNAYRASLASPAASTGEARRQRFMAGLPSPPRPTEPVTFTPEEASALNAAASTGESVRSDGASEECTDCGASRYVFRVYGCGRCTCPMKTPAPVPASATPPTCSVYPGTSCLTPDRCSTAGACCAGDATASATPGETPDGEHVDFTPQEQAAAGYSSLSGSGWTSCRLCGKVKPAGGWTTKCKGQTGIALRASATPGETPDGREGGK